MPNIKHHINIFCFIISACALAAICCIDNAAAQMADNAQILNKAFAAAGNDMARYEIRCDEKGDKDYIAYCRFVREKIKKTMVKNCKYYYAAGDVALLFILNPDGSLSSRDIDYVKSTKEKRLVDMALSGLIMSSPFPPFPKKMESRPTPFSVVISFQKE